MSLKTTDAHVPLLTTTIMETSSLVQLYNQSFRGEWPKKSPSAERISSSNEALRTLRKACFFIHIKYPGYILRFIFDILA